MIGARQFIAEASRQGFDFYTGVPCSFLTPLINGVISDRALSYVGAASEGEAVAIAAGAWLAGKMPVVMCQNSGLGNAVNPLTSLNASFRIPALMIVTWRGQPGHPDEPQHDMMGVITHDLLSLMQVQHAAFPAQTDEIATRLSWAADAIKEKSLPVAFVMKKSDVEDTDLDAPQAAPPLQDNLRNLCKGGTPPARAAVLEQFLRLSGEDRAVIATTGKTGRELFMIGDRKQHLYLVGSMGGAGGVGLGVALNSTRPVAVLDGDGAALMKLGTLATIGAYAPQNLLHILLDNGVHDSTGGQPTVSGAVDFATVAMGCGYRRAASCDTLEDFAALFTELSHLPGPALLHVKIAPGSLDKLIRPTVKPPEVALRFKAFLAERA